MFGCISYIQIPKQLRKKLDSKCKQVCFVGYCEPQKAIVSSFSRDENIMKISDTNNLEVSITSSKTPDFPVEDPIDENLAAVPDVEINASLDGNVEELPSSQQTEDPVTEERRCLRRFTRTTKRHEIYAGFTVICK